jgi:cytochrome oxidase Cu insertion factor (SCO1/SenC/PrrC family)
MMTRTLLSLILVACALAPVVPAQGQMREKPVGVGEVAPDITLMDHNGQKRSLAAERGKRPVVLVFYRGYW